MFTNLECPLQCDGPTLQSHTPGPILECKKLRSTSQKEDINHIYGTIVEQEIISRVLCKLMTKRNILLEQLASNLPGVIPDSSPNLVAAVVP